MSLMALIVLVTLCAYNLSCPERRWTMEEEEEVFETSSWFSGASSSSSLEGEEEGERQRRFPHVS